MQLCNILADTPLGTLLGKVPRDHWMKLYQSYLNDILRNVHHISHTNPSDEYKVHYNSDSITVVCLGDR